MTLNSFSSLHHSHNMDMLIQVAKGGEGGQEVWVMRAGPGTEMKRWRSKRRYCIYDITTQTPL